MTITKVFLLLAFSAMMLLEAHKFTDETDKQALFDFKSQVSEDKRVVLSSWNNSFPLCSWIGVTCGRKHKKRVTSLNLNGFKLGGVISPSIGNLSFLVSLNLTDNSFGGTIPREVGNLFRLKHLFMRFNYLTGGIPTSLANCSRLLKIQLHSNFLGQNVPWELGSLSKLVILDLGKNKLKGKVPTSLGNLTSLRELSLGDNDMEGQVPNDIARLSKLLYLDLSTNRFSGVFPRAIYNFSSLEYLNIFSIGFSGSLRHDFGDLLPNIRTLHAGNNSFTGVIPATLTNISTLRFLGLELNSLIGSISQTFGKMQNLETISLHSNYLGSYSSGDLDFLDAITNCTQLQTLIVSNNTFGGNLPSSIANLSTSLINLSLGRNRISGSIPRDIGNLINLRYLVLKNNLLTGPVPISLGKISGLVVVSVTSNRFSGDIPSSIGNITGLVNLDLSNNTFEGVVPSSIGQCTQLLYLFMENNKLSGTIPKEIMKISPLVLLSLSNNSLFVSLPKEVGGLGYLGTLSVAHNKLSGKLPKTLGDCLSLEILYLQGNFFDGTIPDISGLVGVRKVDLSNNHFYGTIPRYLANFTSLAYLNLSGNNFKGEVPTEGKFKNTTIVSVFGNKNLCGGILELGLKPCFSQERRKGAKHSSLIKKVVIGISTSICFLLLLCIASVFIIWRFNNIKKNKTNDSTPSTLRAFHEMISYGDLRNATNCFSPTYLIGSGNFGTVFKAMFREGNKVVAVKVLNVHKQGAMKSFMAECESLKNIRHRNLVKLLTACSTIDFQGNEFRALVYEFMSNGSLDTWLHPNEVEEILRPSRTLTLLERLNVAIDVASVLDYLHFHCQEAIAHCDLKPSNVLLDDDLSAHLSDFGLARILDQESFLNQLSSAGVRGTIGYVAPEYGMGGKISIHGDVYSFGILLLEIFSGKRPTDELFERNFTIQRYIKSTLLGKVVDAADESMLYNGLRIGFPIVECLRLVFEVGLRCCEESPTNRLAISEAVKQLISIKERFFKARRGPRHY